VALRPIAVVTENLKAFGELVANQPGIEVGTARYFAALQHSPAMRITTAGFVVDDQEHQPALTTTLAATAVSGKYRSSVVSVTGPCVLTVVLSVSLWILCAPGCGLLSTALFADSVAWMERAL